MLGCGRSPHPSIWGNLAIFSGVLGKLLDRAWLARAAERGIHSIDETTVQC